MEGRSVVLTASYWIGVGALRKSRRQIRVAIFRDESECEATAEQM